MMNRITAVLEWIEKHWSTLATLLILVAGWFHIVLKIERGPPGSDPQIVIVIPDAPPKVIRGANPQIAQRIVSLVQTLAVNPDALERAEDAAAASVTIK